MSWLGWFVVAAAMALWGLGALGFLDELKALLRGDDQAEHHGGDRGGGGH